MMRQRIYYILMFLAFAGILSACDPAASCYLSVYKFIANNDIPYIVGKEKLSWGLGSCPTYEDHYFQSNNLGKTWKEISSLPFDTPPAEENPQPSQEIVCVPLQADTCYRISGKDQVDISLECIKSV